MSERARALRYATIIAAALSGRSIANDPFKSDGRDPLRADRLRIRVPKGAQPRLPGIPRYRGKIDFRHARTMSGMIKTKASLLSRYRAYIRSFARQSHLSRGSSTIFALSISPRLASARKHVSLSLFFCSFPPPLRPRTRA